MTLDQFRYFLEAAKFEHIGRAALSIHISPSAISNAIQTLEEEFNSPLFERKGKRIYLTAQGRYLKQQLESIFDQISGIKKGFHGKDAELSGTFRLGASHFLSTRYLSRAWFDLQKKHPRLIGELCSMSTAEVVAELLSGTLDLGLCISPLNHPDLKQFDVFRGQVKIAVRENHPLLRRSQKPSLKELVHYPATIHKSSKGVDICDNHPSFIFGRYNLKPDIRCFFDSDDHAVESLRTSDSWAVLPDIVFYSFSKQLKAFPLPKEWDEPYYISVVIPKSREENPALLGLKDQISVLFRVLV